MFCEGHTRVGERWDDFRLRSQRHRDFFDFNHFRRGAAIKSMASTSQHLKATDFYHTVAYGSLIVVKDNMDHSDFRIVPKPVRQQAEEALRQAIITGRFAPGEHLSDRIVCEVLGASRTVVREAIRLLEAEGLVTVIPHRGSFVAFLSAAEAAQIYEVRGVLEALAGEAFATRASEEERSDLRAVFERLARMKSDAGNAALLELKQSFYAVLLKGGRNAYVARMLDQILNRNMQLRATSMSEPGRLPRTIEELRRVVEATERRDGEEAWAACRAHVQSAATAALRILRANERKAQEAERPQTS